MKHTRMLLRRAAVAAFFIASAAPALAQSFTGVAPSGRVFGNAGASAAPGSWVTATAWFDRAFCAVNNSVPVRQAGTWSCATIGSVLQAWDADLDAIASLSGTGIATRTATNTWATRTLTAPTAGITITNPAGIAGNPTFALANDLAAVEGLTGTGCVARTGADAWNTRTITGTANEITVTNGDCVGGNPIVSLPAALTLTGKTITGGSFENASIGSTTPAAATFTNATAQNLLRWQNAVTSTQIPANQNDYTGSDGTNTCSTRGVLRISSDAARSITGLSCGQNDGQLKLLVNVGSFDIVLSNEDPLSTAANRFALNSSITLGPATALTLRYDGTSSRWRPIAGAGSGGGGAGSVTSVAVSSTDLSVSGSPITTSGTITLNVANDAVTNAKLANMGNFLIKCRYTAGTGDPEDCSGPNVRDILFQAPQVVVGTSGTNVVYNTPSGAKYLKLRACGGGGGGAGNGVSGGGTGGTGGQTCFGTNATACTSATITANGGSGGTFGNPGSAGIGGAAAGGHVNITGANGDRGHMAGNSGSQGGSSPFGGAGTFGPAAADMDAKANSCSGGGGAIQNGGNSGGGGGAGGYVELLLAPPAASYRYTVGTGGAGGAAGASGIAGGAGGSGIIIIEAHFMFLMLPDSEGRLVPANDNYYANAQAA